jgi:aspartyl protease family protein
MSECLYLVEKGSRTLCNPALTTRIAGLKARNRVCTATVHDHIPPAANQGSRNKPETGRMRRETLAWLGIGVLVLAAIVLVVNHSAGTVGQFTNSDFARLATGIALLIVIGGAMFATRALNLGTTLRNATIWLAAALVLISLYSFRDEFAYLGQRVFGELIPGAPIVSTDTEGRTVVSLRRNDTGHFGARGRVDGASAIFLVDTGASVLTLTAATARSAGFDPGSLSYSVPVSTANGTTFMAPVTVDRLQIGPLDFRSLRAYVAPPGSLGDNLLGVNVLDRLESYSVRGDEMVLTGRG